jgi:hypothetical protein
MGLVMGGFSHFVPDESQPSYSHFVPDNSGPVPPNITDNPNGEGTYAMWNDKGQKLGIPYSKVSSAQQKGYQFDTNSTRSGLTPAQQFIKDQAADKTRTGGTSLAMRSNPSQTENAQPGTGLNLVAGVAKGAGTLATPVLDIGNLIAKHTGGNPVDINKMLAAHGAAQTIGKIGTIGATIVPSAVLNPAGTALALGGGAVGGTVGHVVGNATGMSPEATALLSDAGGIAGGAAGGGLSTLLPNKANAVATLNAVSNAAKNEPVNLEATQQALSDFVQYVKTGGKNATVVNKLLRRISPTAPRQSVLQSMQSDLSGDSPAAHQPDQLMFPEARQFYTNISRATARPGFLRRAIESPSAPDMRRNLGNVREAMNSDLTNAADSVGMGDQYTQGMSEYKNAAKLNRAVKIGGALAVGEALRRSGILGKVVSSAASMGGQ